MQPQFIQTFSALVFLGVSLQMTSVLAATPPASEYEKLPSTQKGGTLVYNILQNPKEINPILSNDAEFSQKLSPILWMPLYADDENKLGPVRAIAVSHEISKDKKTYTFKLDPLAQWQDGTPVTADDYKFTLDLILNPKINAAVKRSYLSGTTAEVVDAHTIRFKVDSPKFDTFLQLYTFQAIQKKQFEKEADFNRSPGIMNPIGNGPYLLKSFSRDQKLEFVRNTNWWAKDLPAYKNRFNFDTILFRVTRDANLIYERFVNKDFDIAYISADTFVQKVRGSDAARIGTRPNDGKPIWAANFENKAPMSTYDLAWNLESPLFKSVKTRRALAHLIHRDSINEKIFYGLRVKSFSFFGTKSINAHPDIQKDGTRIDFDVKKGLALLAEDGWKDTDQDNLLDKEINGKKTPFRFVLRFPNSSAPRSKIAQIIREDFKKAGIDVVVQGQDFAVFSEDLDHHRFEAALIGWVPSPYTNPKQVWHSTSAAGGSNYSNYKNPVVDQLIDQANAEFDLKKRAKILQKIDLILFQDQPYALLNEEKGQQFGFSNRIQSPHWFLDYSQAPAMDLFWSSTPH